MGTASKLSQIRPSRLSQRETEVLKLISLEYTTLEIARILYISKNTVESHRRKLLIKMNCRNSAGLVRVACEHSLI